VSIEDLTKEELVKINKYYTRLAEITKKEKSTKTSHSIEDIEYLKDQKQQIRKRIRPD
jgi:hypothetical protein